MATDVMVYSERKEAIEEMVSLYVSPEDDGEGGRYWPGINWDWMPPGTMLLKPAGPDYDPETGEPALEAPEYDEDNWYCNVRFADDQAALDCLAAAEAAFQEGTQVKHYPSERQPGVNHHFPYLRIEYDPTGSPGALENVYFTRKDDGSYLPGWPRRIYQGGMRQPEPAEVQTRAATL